ncbi:membrane protein insertion efficiency factor YidD [Acidipropionibacterium acidipropionici]|jgi:putative membrane protein insertion efficiency factor|uniref:membrane protein insertion efficiency factor YidD n=1 Tax=Acidipropionibacterium acidipropionici TaxID=1748 RepID=UPI0004074B7E|nr:membrane protein insertion efficiency factor YidD [Acidipropionibacterium acidipropionici]
MSGIEKVPGRIRFRPVTWLAIGFVKAWRLLISPLYGEVCKYKPSCSAYGLRALQVHGVLRATPMIVWRILRCNPWSNGGYDPVPGTPEAEEWERRQAQRTVEAQLGPDAEGTASMDHDTIPGPPGPDEPAGAPANWNHPRARRPGKHQRTVGEPAVSRCAH